MRKSYLMIKIPIFIFIYSCLTKNSTSAFETQESHELSKFVNKSLKKIMVNGKDILYC